MPPIAGRTQFDETQRPLPRRRALLFINSRARGGRCDPREITRTLEADGLAVRLVQCSRREDLSDLIRAHAREADIAVIGGGDGTINAAAPGLLDTGIPLGILPLGTANDLARTLGIPTDPLAATRFAASGPLRAIDVGEVNGIPFFNVAGIGISVDLARELTREMKRRWGSLGYALAAFRVLGRLRPFSAEIRIAGQAHRVKSVQIGVGNGRHYGGGMTVEENAAPDDGLLDVYSIDVKGWWELPLLYPAFRAGRQGEWKNVHTWDCTEAEVVTRRPLPVNTDGEITTRTPARFVVRPHAVRIACPPRPRTADGPPGGQPDGRRSG